MCGIAGYYMHRGIGRSATDILQMTRALSHRGPDDEGIALFGTHVSPTRSAFIRTTATAAGVRLPNELGEGDRFDHSIAFGHRRFSIVDVSVDAHQPFSSSNEKVCLSFNGEIYNYVDLRAELERQGFRFRTSSDTEVFATAYEHWGEACFERFVGFWAASIYDARTNRLLLARDRLGKAPLYFYRSNDRLLWASEIKGILTVEGRQTFAVNEQALTDFVAIGLRDFDDSTMFESIRTFPSASFAWIKPDGTFEAKSFWQLPHRRLTEQDIGIEAATTLVRKAVTDAVGVRLRADVPIGFELSGGLDSSVLTAVAVQSGITANAFTVAFTEAEANEERFAAAVCDRYPDAIHYTVLTPPNEAFVENADEYVRLMDEPFHSPNMLTNNLIWRRMHQLGMRVSINGAAGDEVFAGYGFYFGPHLESLLRTGELRALFEDSASWSESPVRRLSGAHLTHASWAVRRLVQRLAPKTFARVRAFRQGYGARKIPLKTGKSARVRPAGTLQQILSEDMRDWRMNYWLRSGNQSAMTVPIEVRAPFLDYRVIELAMTLPTRYLVRHGWQKWILRKAFESALPNEVVWRKRKMGFPFPYTSWLFQVKPSMRRWLLNVDCPYLDLKSIFSDYDDAAQRDPHLLWRMLSVGLWWKRCVLNEYLG